MAAQKPITIQQVEQVLLAYAQQQFDSGNVDALVNMAARGEGKVIEKKSKGGPAVATDSKAINIDNRKLTVITRNGRIVKVNDLAEWNGSSVKIGKNNRQTAITALALTYLLESRGQFGDNGQPSAAVSTPTTSLSI